MEMTVFTLLYVCEHKFTLIHKYIFLPRGPLVNGAPLDWLVPLVSLVDLEPSVGLDQWERRESQ